MDQATNNNLDKNKDLEDELNEDDGTTNENNTDEKTGHVRRPGLKPFTNTNNNYVNIENIDKCMIDKSTKQKKL